MSTSFRSLDELRGVTARAREAGMQVLYSTNEDSPEARVSGAVTHRSYGSDFDARYAFAIADRH